MFKFIIRMRQKYPRFMEIIRFLIIGGIATLIDMAVMFMITYLPYRNSYTSIFDAVINPITPTWLIVISTAIGFLVGLIFNYIFSIIYVYLGDNSKAKTPKALLKFTVLSAIGLLIQTLGMYLLNGLLNINEWIIKIVLVVVVLVFNYITRKKFIFNNRTNEPSLEKDNNI